MRVLIGQEFSGVIRRAFAARGHFAVSVDLLPAEDHADFRYFKGYSSGGHHHVGDIMDFIFNDVTGLMAEGFDLAIFHPDCTNLTNAGIRRLYLDGREENGRDEQRWTDMRRDAAHYRRLKTAPIKRIAVENPRMHPYGEKLCEVGRRQFVQPWNFGENETKATGLELINLPKLRRKYLDYAAFRFRTGLPMDAKPEPKVHHASPGPDRWKDRSRTLPGIGDAMAEQWGALPT